MGNGVSKVSPTNYQQPLQPNQLKHINQKTNAFLRDTENLAGIISKTDIRTQQQTQTTVVNNYYDSWWSPYRPYYYYPPFFPEVKTPEAKKEELGRLAFFGGLAVLVGTIYGVAVNIGSLIGIHSQNTKNEKFAKWFDKLVQDPRVEIDANLGENIGKMIKIKERIFARTQTDTEVSLVCKAFLGAGGGILALGGWNRDEDRMIMGVAIAGIASLALLIKAGIGYAERKNGEDVQKLRDKIVAVQEKEVEGFIKIKNTNPKPIKEVSAKKETIESELSLKSLSSDLSAISSASSAA